jgi:hypothetical protein
MNQAEAARRSRPAPRALAGVAILVVAVFVRVLWLVLNRHQVLANDPADYQRLAVSVASGHGFGTTVVAPGGGPTAFRPPLWPLFLGALYWVVGTHVMVARAVEVVLGTLTVGLIGLIARQLWSAATALVAMVIAAVYPPLLLAGGSLLSESLSLPLELGSLGAALSVRRSSHPWRGVILAGVLAGLDVLARPDSFTLLVPIALVLAGAGTRRLARVLAAFVIAGLVVSPWLVRDGLVMGRFIPVTTQSGLVASGTYNDTSADDPVYRAAWRPVNLVPEYRPLLRGTEVEEEASLRKASLHYISAHPLYPLRVSGWNLLRLFDLTGLSDPQGSWAANGYSSGWADTDALGLGAAAAAILLGLGARVARRVGGRRQPAVASSGWRVSAPVWLAPVLIGLVTVPVLGESRLRVGLDPFLILAAAVGVAQWWKA